MRNKLYFLLAAWAFFLSPLANAQEEGSVRIEPAEQKQVIDSVSRRLLDNYVFPEVAQKMSTLIRENYQKGVYKATASVASFAEKLTEDLRSVSKDKHLRVAFNPQVSRQLQNNAGGGDEPPSSYLENMRMSNYGFREVKLIEGNVGYLDLRGFTDARFGGETAVAAMNFLSNASALIIDLRKNGGGSPSMIQLITSYLYGAEPVHLNNFYFRPANQNTQTWTLPHVQGKRRPDIPVYVLTSNKTFSAAEEFTYNLKNLKRATIIGETTGGGAHPGGTLRATDRFTVWVPTGRAINPITNTNWEGVGVKPDIEVKAEEALLTAHVKALEGLAAKSTGTIKQRYEWELLSLQSKKEPVQVAEATLKNYAGTFGEKKIVWEDGGLYFFPFPDRKVKLTPLTHEIFELNEISNVRLQVLTENKTVVGIAELFNNGRVDKHLKKSF
ncbi:MAG TPA: S41 family peptidase [Flavisolibacter sp.]|jgi:hypothetical protein|nr:S41 family peptidase [Flavisolibacter sp.]